MEENEPKKLEYPLKDYAVARAHVACGMSAHDGTKLEGGGCRVLFGRCSPIAGDERSFGPPDVATPHICDGGLGHRSKLHRCGFCNCLGARVQPTRWTAAGREYERLVKADATRKVLRDAQAFRGANIEVAPDA